MAIKGPMVGAGIVAMAIVAGAVASQARQTTTERRIRASAGTSVLAQVRSSDHALTIIATNAPPDQVLPPPGVTLIQWLTDHADAVFQVRIENQRGRLNDSGDFIETDITATVLDTLKSPQICPVGSEFTFTWQGGEMTWNGVKISGELPWRKDPQTGKPYLAFVSCDPSTQRLFVDLWQQTPSAFVTLLNQADAAAQQLDGSTQDTLQAVRAAVTRGK